MLVKNNKGDIVFAKNAEHLSEVRALKTRGKEWVDKAIRYCYYMWSEETSDLYHNLLPSKKSMRVCKDFLDGFDFKEFTESDVYVNFENAYIDTQYTPEWATYIAWQQDAEQYTKLNRQEKLTIENHEKKMSLMKNAKDLLLLGKEYAQIARKEGKFKKKENEDATLFEIPTES